MFKISTKGDYGLLLLSALAEKTRDSTAFVSLKEIANEKHLSVAYISQIIMPLKNAGLVESKEGRDGGYRLARDAKKISLMEVLEALEGPMSPVRCCSDTSAKCGSEAQCNVKFAWQDAQHMLSQFFKNKTLADVLNPKNNVIASETKQSRTFIHKTNEIASVANAPSQ